jgi:hypothetical protein
VAASTTLADFDDGDTAYLSGYVKGANLLWSQILEFPAVAASRFDNASTKAVEVTINQDSIFNGQNGFRRAGLIFSADSNSGSPGATGVKTLHFSVQQDAMKALNLSHEYLNVWHETTDYSADQVMFETGTIIGQEGLPKNNFKILGRNSNLIWSVPMASSGWQNFAITLGMYFLLLSFFLVHMHYAIRLQHSTDPIKKRLRRQHAPSRLLGRQRAPRQAAEQPREQRQLGRRPVPDRHPQEADGHDRRRQRGLPGVALQRGPDLRRHLCRGLGQRVSEHLSRPLHALRAPSTLTGPLILDGRTIESSDGDVRRPVGG